MNFAAGFRHLERATDAAFMGDFFASHLERLGAGASGLISCYIPRVFPRKDNAFAIQYELHLKTRDHTSAQRLLLCGLLGAATERGVEVKAGYDVAHCLEHPELNLIVPVLPFDPGLPGLVEFWDVARANDRLAQLRITKDASPLNGTIVHREVLGYRLERRCTLSYDCAHITPSDGTNSNLELIAKIVPPKKLARVLHTVAMLERHVLSRENPKGVTIPLVLGADTDLGAIIMEKSHGIALHELVGHADYTAASAAAGLALRQFHARPEHCGDFAIRTVASELSNLSGRVQLLCTIFLSCASTVQRAYHMLTAHAVSDIPSTEVRFVHGDFHDKQVLFAKGQTTLLDYDNASLGDPAQDVGNFLAHLDLRRLQHPEAGGQISLAGEMFMASYASGDESFARRVEWWRAATLMRLASLYALRPRWRHLTLELAEQCQLYAGARTTLTKGI